MSTTRNSAHKHSGQTIAQFMGPLSPRDFGESLFYAKRYPRCSAMPAHWQYGRPVRVNWHTPLRSRLHVNRILAKA